MTETHEIAAEPAGADETAKSEIAAEIAAELACCDGDFENIEYLGQGATSFVFKAHDQHLGLSVAIKVLKPHLLDSDSSINRFLREAKTANLLRHDGIARTFRLGLTATSKPYMVMEFVPGKRLSDWLVGTGKLSAQQCLNLLDCLLPALESAHEKGFVHRDLKPGNIMVNADCTVSKLLDFGLVRYLWGDDEQKLTPSGAVLGSPLYMSPEQSRGEAAGPKSDLYSLGCVLYECLTGSAPYATADSEWRQPIELGRAPSKVRKLPPAVPTYLRNLVLNMISKDPKDRPSATQALEVLRDKKVVATLEAKQNHSFAPKEVLKLLCIAIFVIVFGGLALALCVPSFQLWLLEAFSDAIRQPREVFVAGGNRSKPAFLDTACANVYRELSQKFDLQRDAHSASIALRRAIGLAPMSKRAAYLKEMRQMSDLRRRDGDEVESKLFYTKLLKGCYGLLEDVERHKHHYLIEEARVVYPLLLPLPEKIENTGPNAYTLGRIGAWLASDKQYEAAITCLDRAIQMYPLCTSDQDIPLANAYGDLAECEFRLGKSGRIDSLMELDLNTLEKSDADVAGTTATEWRRWGQMCVERKMFKDAEHHFKKAIALERKSRGPNFLHYTLFDLYLALHRAGGREKEAADALNESHRILRGRDFDHAYPPDPGSPSFDLSEPE